MRVRYYIIILLFISLFCCLDNGRNGRKVICEFSIETDKLGSTDSIISINLNEITTINDSILSFYEIIDDRSISTHFQIEKTDTDRILYWKLSDDTTQNSIRQYNLVIENSKQEPVPGSVSIVNQDGVYKFISSGKNILEYNSQIVHPPEGVDTSYKRSGFINPLFAPNQTILTRIPNSTSDHLHHYGLWNAWKKVIFKGDTIDFFAPQFGQGTVRHVDVISESEGPIFSSLKSLRDHIVWQHTDKEEIAMKDLMEIKVYNKHDDKFLIDISYTYAPLDTFLIKEYRYAGFSFRATDYWTNSNAFILTSEGKNRDEGNSERARWCLISGNTPKGKASILFMSHPANHNHPEPMRIWPSNSNNGVGNIYINFNPTGNKDWILLPGNNYILRYRILIANGEISPKYAEEIWMAFSNLVDVVIN